MYLQICYIIHMPSVDSIVDDTLYYKCMLFAQLLSKQTTRHVSSCLDILLFNKRGMGE